jgi:hypothetical protein
MVITRVLAVTNESLQFSLKNEYTGNDHDVKVQVF